jgi:hypothetical protein
MMQDVAPLLAAYEPPLQRAHDELLAALLKEPRLQREQFEAAKAAVNLPAGQAAQAVCPVSELKVPGTQMLQADPPAMTMACMLLTLSRWRRRRSLKGDGVVELPFDIASSTTE